MRRIESRDRYRSYGTAGRARMLFLKGGHVVMLPKKELGSDAAREGTLMSSRTDPLRIRTRLSASWLLAVTIVLAWSTPSAARFPETPPRVLIIEAHPDDETACAASVYKITHDLHGTVDLAVITDGQGGYKYSTLANDFYHLNLTDESIGRTNLPRIRRRELRAAGAILGIRHYTFFDQKDARYTLDIHEALDSLWNVNSVLQGANRLLRKGHYDFVFTLLPTPSTHGHHKAACVLALRAAQALADTSSRPIVLALTGRKKGEPDSTNYTQLAGYPQTRVSDAAPGYSFDRTQSFGFNHALNYEIIVNWEIAEHKSQGTMQLAMNGGDVEDFWYFDINPASGRDRTKRLFDALAVNHYPELTYPGEHVRADRGHR